MASKICYDKIQFNSSGAVKAEKELLTATRYTSIPVKTIEDWLLGPISKSVNYLTPVQVTCPGCTDGTYKSKTYYPETTDMSGWAPSFTTSQSVKCVLCHGTQVADLNHDRISMFLFENLQMSLEELQDKIWCNVCQKTITVSEYRKHLGQHPGVLEFDTAVTCIFCYECMNMGEYLQSHECPNTKCKYCQNICKKESKSHVPSKYDKIAPCNDSINRRIRDRLRADTAEWILKSKSSDKSIGST